MVTTETTLNGILSAWGMDSEPDHPAIPPQTGWTAAPVGPRLSDTGQNEQTMKGTAPSTAEPEHKAEGFGASIGRRLLGKVCDKSTGASGADRIVELCRAYTKETGSEMNNDFSTAAGPHLVETPVFPQDGWNPLTGRREFRSANQAWDMYGQYRFGISKRTFLNYVGKEKRCRPRPDMTYHIEDIEKFSSSEGWPPAPAFARLAPQGERGGSADATCYGEMYQMENALTQRAVRQAKELEVDRKLKRLIPRGLYEQSLAAAAVVASTGLEAFVYDSVREIIHLCGGTLEKEDALREYMLERVKDCLNGFSEAFEYDVELEARLDEEAEKEASRGDALSDRESDA